MKNLLNPQIKLLEENPEVKSYISQQIMDFEPYITEETVITILARDPSKLALQFETDNKEFDLKKLKKMYRIAITLSEGDTRIEAEGLHENIYEAIRHAKENLINQLAAIHDSIVSNQDRLVEINHFLQNPNLH